MGWIDRLCLVHNYGFCIVFYYLVTQISVTTRKIVYKTKSLKQCQQKPGQIYFSFLVFYPPWTQPRQAKKNSESEPPVEANITIVIFRVRLALGIF